VKEQEHYWFLARLYVVLRRSLISTHIAPLYSELATVLTNASGVQIDSTTPGDDELLDLFRPVAAVEPTPEPVEPVDQPKPSRRRTN
jgi:hypothetical protein